MKKNLLLIALSFTVLSCFSQNWQTVVSTRTALFQYLTYTRIINIKYAIVVGADSVFYNFRSMDDDVIDQAPLNTNPMCNMDTSWNGVNIIIRPNGDNVFVTETLDSVFIKTLANLNDTWRLYDYVNGNYLEAAVSSVYAGTILSEADSMKEIFLQLRDSLGNPLTGNLNGHQFTLSKNHGLTQTLPFRHFPNFYPAHHLIGLSNPPLGVQNLTAYEIYDFDIGDLFQYYIKYSTSNTIQIFNTQHIITGKTISVTQDTVTYVIDDSTWNEIQYMNSNFYFSHSTFSKTYIFRPTFINSLSVFPHELGIDSVSNSTYSEQVIDNNYNSRSSKSVFTSLIPTSLCANYYFYPGDYWCASFKETYVKGLGEVLEENVNPYATRICEWYMNYYKKGNETWGMPVLLYQLVNTSEMQKNQVEIYPNPFSESFTISNIDPSTEKIVVSDLTGRELFTQKTSGNSQLTVSMSNLTKGIYQVDIKSSSDFIHYKVVKN